MSRKGENIYKRKDGRWEGRYVKSKSPSGKTQYGYSAIETNKRKMSWNTFLSLLLVFGYNEKTATMLEMSGAFPVELKNILNVDRRKEDK